MQINRNSGRYNQMTVTPSAFQMRTARESSDPTKSSVILFTCLTRYEIRTDDVTIRYQSTYRIGISKNELCFWFSLVLVYVPLCHFKFQNGLNAVVFYEDFLLAKNISQRNFYFGALNSYLIVLQQFDRFCISIYEGVFEITSPFNRHFHIVLSILEPWNTQMVLSSGPDPNPISVNVNPLVFGV